MGRGIVMGVISGSSVRLGLEEGGGVWDGVDGVGWGRFIQTFVAIDGGAFLRW